MTRRLRAKSVIYISGIYFPVNHRETPSIHINSSSSKKRESASDAGISSETFLSLKLQDSGRYRSINVPEET